jgi:hypothetical protein
MPYSTAAQFSFLRPRGTVQLIKKPPVSPAIPISRQSSSLGVPGARSRPLYNEKRFASCRG